MTAYKTAVSWHCAYNGRETGCVCETRTVREFLSSFWSLVHATVTRSDAKSQSQHFTGFTHQCWRSVCVCVWVSDEESVWVFRRHDSRSEGVRQKVQCKKIVSNRKWKSQRACVVSKHHLHQTLTQVSWKMRPDYATLSYSPQQSLLYELQMLL